jgi:restriction system protein
MRFDSMPTAYWWAIPVVLVVLVLQSESGKGMLGQMAANLFAKVLLTRSGYRLIKDVRLPGEDGTTRIDQIIVSRFGVFVVDMKNVAGYISGTPDQEMWTQEWRHRSRSFPNPLQHNYRQVRALRRLLNLDGKVFHPLVVFIRDSRFKTPMPDNVTNLAGYIRSIRSNMVPLLSDQQVTEIVSQVRSGLPASSLRTNPEPARPITEVIAMKPTPVGSAADAIKAEAMAEGFPCPQCGAKLLRLTFKTGPKAGSTFIGCSDFPSCRFSQPSPSESA